MLWLLTLVACDKAEGLCLQVGLGAETCSDPTIPVEGPWTALLPADTPLVDCDVRPVDLDDGWNIAPAGPSFTLAAPVGAGGTAAAATCTYGDGAFACEPAPGPGGVEVTVSGTLASRSQASLVIDLASPTCDTQVEAPFVATWTLDAPEPACPDIEDDAFEQDREVPTVSVQVTNAGTQSLGLYLLAGQGPLFQMDVAAGAVGMGSAQPGNWMMLATGFGQEACVFAFEVTGDGQEVTYWGE